jgi:hypothetical protein
MNVSPEEALFALALEKPAEKRALFREAICAGYTCASAKQPIDPLDERDDQRCLSPARFYRDVWT